MAPMSLRQRASALWPMSSGFAVRLSKWTPSITLSVLNSRWPRPPFRTAASSPESTTMRPARFPMRPRIQRMRSSSDTAGMIAQLRRPRPFARVGRASAHVLPALGMVRRPARLAAHGLGGHRGPADRAVAAGDDLDVPEDDSGDPGGRDRFQHE